jgi:hypothetical protein
MERSDARISSPGEDQLLDAPSSDQLIVEKIWSQTNRGEVLLPLPDDLLPSGEGNKMGEAFEGHCVAVMKMRRDR